MRKLILILALALLIGSAGAIKWSGIELREDANLTMDDGFVNGTGGIVFNGTAPTSTEGVLYSDSGILKFNGASVGGSGSPAYTAMIKQVDSDYIAYAQNGTALATSTNFTTTFNSLMWALAGTKKVIYLDFETATVAGTAYLENYTEVIGIGRPTITTTAVEPIFLANSTTGLLHSYIKIKDVILRYDGSTAYSRGHIELYNTSYSTIEGVYTGLDNLSYSANNRGGVYLNGAGAHAWLNLIRNCHLSMVVMSSATDNWIDANAICSWEDTAYAIKTSGACNNLKITKNHIIVPGVAGSSTYGIFNSGATSGWYVAGNWFEPQDGYDATEQQIGIFTSAAMSNCRFIDNGFVNLGSMGMNFHGNVLYSTISGNVFENCNRYNDANFRAISTGTGSCYNSFVGNTGYNYISSTKAPFIWGSDHSSYSANVVYGKFSDDISNAGSGSVEAGTVATLT